MASSVLDHVINLIGIVSASYGTIWFSKWLEERKAKRKNNMDHEYDRKNKIVPILEEMLFELNCTRVQESQFSNGDITFSGVHMKKLSILNEVYSEGLEPVAPHFQLIPVRMYQRNMDMLYDSKDDFCVFKESFKQDDLASLNRKFGFNTMICAKIRDIQGRWIGLLTAIWDIDREPTQEEIAYVKLQAARIGSIK